MPSTADKESQFFGNLLNILPLQGVIGRSMPLTTKEAKVLMTIWESETNDQGQKLVPISSDFKLVESLIEKGILENSSKRAVSLYPIGNYVEFTKKGKDIVKSIILHTERSSFDKKASDWTVEEVFSKNVKIASSQPQPRNWLERVINKWS